MRINRAGDGLGERKRLSAFGKAVAAAAAVIVILGIVIAVRASAGNAAKKERLKEVDAAIEYAMQTCANTLAATGMPGNEIDEINQRLSKTKKVSERVELGYEAIRIALGLVDGDVKALDELNGAKNRISIAYKNYNSL